eukprot:PhM_4_TR19057/c0_g1_i1/m.3459
MSSFFCSNHTLLRRLYSGLLLLLLLLPRWRSHNGCGGQFMRRHLLIPVKHPRVASAVLRHRHQPRRVRTVHGPDPLHNKQNDHKQRRDENNERENNNGHDEDDDEDAAVAATAAAAVTAGIVAPTAAVHAARVSAVFASDAFAATSAVVATRLARRRGVDVPDRRATTTVIAVAVDVREVAVPPYSIVVIMRVTAATRAARTTLAAWAIFFVVLLAVAQPKNMEHNEHNDGRAEGAKQGVVWPHGRLRVVEVVPPLLHVLRRRHPRRDGRHAVLDEHGYVLAVAVDAICNGSEDGDRSTDG